MALVILVVAMNFAFWQSGAVRQDLTVLKLKHVMEAAVDGSCRNVSYMDEEDLAAVGDGFANKDTAEPGLKIDLAEAEKDLVGLLEKEGIPREKLRLVVGVALDGLFLKERGGAWSEKRPFDVVKGGVSYRLSLEGNVFRYSDGKWISGSEAGIMTSEEMIEYINWCILARINDSLKTAGLRFFSGVGTHGNKYSRFHGAGILAVLDGYEIPDMGISGRRAISIYSAAGSELLH